MARLQTWPTFKNYKLVHFALFLAIVIFLLFGESDTVSLLRVIGFYLSLDHNILHLLSEIKKVVC